MPETSDGRMPSTPENVSSGTGGSGDPRRGRNRNRGGGSKKPDKDEKFQGWTAELKGYYYHPEITDPKESFQKTTRTIAEFVARKYKGAEEFRQAMISMRMDELVEPTSTDEDAEKPVLYKKWDRECKKYEKKVEQRDENRQTIYNVILGQCTPTMRDRLDGDRSFETIDKSTDVIGLLKLIQTHIGAKHGNQDPSHVLMNANTDFFSFKQGNLSVSDYMAGFKDRVEVLERLQGPLGQDLERVAIYSLVYEVGEEEAKEACRQQYLATNFIFRSNPRIYGALMDQMQNDRVRGGLEYPQTLVDAQMVLTNYIRPRPVHRQHEDVGGLSFIQNGEDQTTHDGRGDQQGRGGRGRGRGGNRSRGAGRGRGNARNNEEHTHAQVDTTNAEQDNNSTSNSSDDYLDYPVIDLRIAESSFLQKKTSPQNNGKKWIIMDSGSTVDMICDASLLTDITSAPTPLKVRCNAGVTVVSQQGTLGKYPNKVWYNPNGIANILGLRNIIRHFRVTYDSSLEDAFVIHHDNGKQSRFKAAKNGLYYLHHSCNASDMWNLMTVQDHQAQYTQRQNAQAQLARRVQHIMMRPSTADYCRIVDTNIVRNCPIERRHIQAAEHIYGPDVGALKGKTPRRTVQHVSVGFNPVPDEILQAHQAVTLAMDIMFVNTLPFLVTYSRTLRFGTVEMLENRQVPTVQRKLLTVLELYRRRGFRIHTILADGEFAALEATTAQVAFNLCGADEHIPEIERYIRTIKDRVRSCYNALPYHSMPRIMLARMVSTAVFWLNSIPPQDGVSHTLSPRYLLTGQHLDYHRHIRIPFGAYAQVHEEHTNDLSPRTAGAICLGPTGNIQGTHFFLSLATGRLLRRPHWTELPTPADVVNRVSQLGTQQGMPRTISFADRYGHEFADGHDEIDDDHDSVFHPDPNDEASSFDPDDESLDPSSAGVGNDDDDIHDDITDAEEDAITLDHRSEGIIDDDRSESVNGINDDDKSEQNEEAEADPGEVEGNATEVEFEDHEQGGNAPRNNQPAELGDPTAAPPRPTSPRALEEIPRTMPMEDTTTGVREQQEDRLPGVDVTRQPTGTTIATTATGEADEERVAGPGVETVQDTTNQAQPKYNLRQRKPGKDPVHIVGNDYADAYQFLTSIGENVAWCLLTAQMSASKGVKMFGKSGQDAIMAEMQQLHYRTVIKPAMEDSMTRDMKKAALHYLMFLKQKRCGKIKARGCADGRKQRLWKTKEETSAPTVRTESVILSAAIDAHEHRKVMIIDIPGAFMQADIDELVHVKFEGETARALLKISPETYGRFVTTTRKGEPVIYCELRKALYGTLQGALLFWKNLSAFLRDELGFTINPYDECVANKLINGKQMTILWHVDDLKISHEDSKELEIIFNKLNDKYGKEAPLTVSRGPCFDYLGMTLDYSQKGRVTIGMDEFVQRILGDAPEDMGGESVTPAANHLFATNKKATKLDTKQAEIFHHLVAMMLYLCKRVRPDIHTAVAFLCTRVTAPDEDDYKKLARCVRYLRAFPDLKLTLEVNPKKVLEWWVDASFAVHPDMKSHTGGMMTMGKGASHTICTKQKINTKSSTEAELVGVDDCMPTIVWTRHFLMAQGFEVSDNVVYQDNQSAILLERNGKRSSGKKTRHIEIRYFFITDRNGKKHVRVEYCPTEEMNADVLTKPLQGSLFRKFRQRMLNLPEGVHPCSEPSQECVGETVVHDQAGPVTPVSPESTSTDHCLYGLAGSTADGWIEIVKAGKRGKLIRKAGGQDGRISFCESQV